MPPFQHLLHIRQQLQLPQQNVLLQQNCPPLHRRGALVDRISNALGGDVSKQLAAGNSSSLVNKWKTLDTVEFTDSEFAADEGENSSYSTGSTKTHCKKKKKHAMKRHKSATDPIDIIQKHANRDLDEFFEEPAAVTGKDGNVRKCRACKICRLRVISDTTTLRQHIESLDNHKAKYNKWACTHNFNSKLPKVLKAKQAHAEDAVARFEQGTIDEHLKEIPKKSRLEHH
ncbi:hypothetical protein JB92DRAFT_2826308 [Gautieria morchelliformis]|nr:hypothetical protein JB92DRAFT_2826308 [Gautieria morchelliformis]